MGNTTGTGVIRARKRMKVRFLVHDWLVFSYFPLARLVRTLNAVHTKLQHLEEENGISRRRVRELEFELEACKREVAWEQSRVEEHSIQTGNIPGRRAAGASKGKGKLFVTGGSHGGYLTAHCTCLHLYKRIFNSRILCCSNRAISQHLHSRIYSKSCN